LGSASSHVGEGAGPNVEGLAGFDLQRFAVEIRHDVPVVEDSASANASLVAELHRRQAEMYAGGPVEPVAELLAESIVWRVPGSSPIAGEHRGVEAVLEYFDKRRALASATMKMHPREVLADEEAVVQLVDGTARIGGEEVGWRTVGVYRVEAGRIHEVWLVPLDLDRFDAIWTGLG
jgi:ketosteroid isomerase-like protein